MRVLIVEDEVLTALDLQVLLEDLGHEVVGPFATVAEARTNVSPAPDFAFLDIDVRDGKSFGLAAELDRSRVPFVFVSGSSRSELPDGLRHARFVAKPYAPATIRSFLGESHQVAC